MAQACDNCTYYDSKHSNPGTTIGDDKGLCRFNPPISQPAPDAQGLWPVVAREDWCGHYRDQSMSH
jgi:hypothetical protein